MDQPPTPPAAAHDEPGRIPLCPVCGYDLRGTAGERCSECGLVIDHADLARSSIPWAYRREIGRARAFRKTVWLVTLDLKPLRHEAAKPQSARDAAVFGRWLAVLVTASLAALAATIMLAVGVAELVVSDPGTFGLAGGGALTGWEQDLAVPWSAGIALPGALFAYAALVAVVLTGAPAEVFRPAGMTPERAEAARAIGRYAAAPLAWLLPAMAAFVAHVVIYEHDPSADLNGFTTIALVLWFLLGTLALGGTIYRVGLWHARVTHAGPATVLLATGELLVRWVVGVTVVLFVVPWCVGLLWIVIDSFRD